MGITEDIADRLAKEAIEAEEKLGDDRLVNQVSEVIGGSSTTTQEAYLTAVRVRRSEARARKFIAEKLAKGARQT
jgi:hypothetical protein